MLDIGRAKRGKMTVKEMLALLEKHEEECNRRYAKIEKGLDKLDRSKKNSTISPEAYANMQAGFPDKPKKMKDGGKVVKGPYS